MPIKIPFKTKFSVEDRLRESTNVKERCPDRIPVVIHKNPNSNIDDIDKAKYLFPLSFTVPQISYIIRKRISLKPDETINIFIQTYDNDEILPSQSSTIESIYNQYVHSFKEHPKYDGYLYLIYSGENVFG
jgi:GABA(A) receptor-associated protein